MEIEKGIPIPPRRQYGNWAASRKAGDMKPGDSMLCESERDANNLRSFMRHRGWKYCQRKVEGGWRVWRLEDPKPRFGMRVVG
jgi:uncharacterized protein (DUF2249 family)